MLSKIQSELKAPKNQRNTFGEYNYRSCEDIVEAVKPLLAKENLYLIMSDKIEHLGENYYVTATATIFDSKNQPIASATASARETMERKKMDSSQLTGAASSYARKYALNGLFAIDDTKDADTMNHEETVKTVKEVFKGAETVDLKSYEEQLKATKDLDELKKVWNEGKVLRGTLSQQDNDHLTEIKDIQKMELTYG